MPVDPVAEAEAALAVVRLEQKLRQLKEDDPDGELPQVKLDLRAARQAQREMREATQSGDGVVRPEPVSMKVKDGRNN